MMKAKLLNKANLQYIAVIAMVLDHVSVFVPNYAVYYIFRFFGRMTIVIMSFFAAEGYYKTRNVYKYIIRMGIFAAVSQLPFYLYMNASGGFHDSLYGFLSANFHERNVIFTLFIGLCLLAILKSDCVKLPVKLLAYAAGLYLTRNSDWRYFCILWITVFGLLRENKTAQMSAASGVVLLRFLVHVYSIFADFALNGAVNTRLVIWTFIQLGGLAAIPVLCLYNGEKGNSPRLGFYLFYPLHLLILAFTEYCIFAL